MSRRLEPTSVGEFKVFFLYLAAVPALSLGVGFTNGTYLWGSDSVNGTNKSRAAFSLALLSGSAASIVVLLAGIFSGWSTTLLLFALACPPIVAGTIYEASLVATEQIRKAALFSSSFEFIRVSSILAALLMGYSVTLIISFYVLASWAKLFAAGASLGILSPVATSFRNVRPTLLKYAVPVSIAAIFDLLVLNADRYVLSTFLLPSDFAIYAFGCLMIPPLFVVEQSINQVLIPKIARAEPGSRAAVGHFRSAVEDLLLILLPATAGLIALSNPLMRFLFTERYGDGSIFLAWYAIFYSLLAIPQDVLARARGDSAWILRASVIFGTVAIFASLIGAKYFGALGALQAFLLVQAGRRIYALLYFAREEKCSFTKMFPTQSALVFLLAALVSALVARQTFSLVARPAHMVLLGGAVFSALYFAIVFSFRRRAVYRLLKMRGKR